jgi:hypothetical protein
MPSLNIAVPKLMTKPWLKFEHAIDNDIAKFFNVHSALFVSSCEPLIRPPDQYPFHRRVACKKARPVGRGSVNGAVAHGEFQRLEFGDDRVERRAGWTRPLHFDPASKFGLIARKMLGKVSHITADIGL